MLKTKGVQACSKVFWCSSINNFLLKTKFIDLDHLINWQPLKLLKIMKRSCIDPKDHPKLIKGSAFEV